MAITSKVNTLIIVCIGFVTYSLCSDELELMDLISMHWDCHYSDVEKQMLYNQLNYVRRELALADNNLAALVFQAIRQAHIHCNSLDSISLGKSIGPFAVVYIEEKLGGLAELVETFPYYINQTQSLPHLYFPHPRQNPEIQDHLLAAGYF